MSKRSLRPGRFLLVLVLMLLLMIAAKVCFGGGFGTIRDTIDDYGPDAGQELSVTKIVSHIQTDLYSEHAILVDLQTGDVLYEKAGGEKTYPASLTKIMTILVAIENAGSLEDEVVLPADMFDDLYVENASLAGYLPGEQVKVVDLLYAAMLASGADATAALAYYIADSESAFVALMNEKAADLHMWDTHFVNASGLHDDDHYTTVGDLSLLLEYALKDDTFRRVFTSSWYYASPTNLHPDGITFYSTMFNALDAFSFTGYEILGGKTGYTITAGLCLASLARKNDREYLLITTDAPGDHESEQYNITDAINVYNSI